MRASKTSFELRTGDVVWERFSSAFSWRATAIACGFMTLTGILAIALGSHHAAVAAALFSILCGSTVVAQLGCACIVLGYGFTARSPENLIVGAAYLVAGLVGATYLLAMPDLAAPMLAANARNPSTPYLWLIWRGAFSLLAALAVAVAIANRSDRKISRVASGFATVAIMILGITVAHLAPALSRSIHHTAMPGPMLGQYRDLLQLGIALGICAVDVAAIVGIASYGRLKASASHTVVLGLFASMIEILITLACGPNSYGWYAGTFFTTVASSAILVAFVSEFTWRRAIEKANVEYSTSTTRERERTQERLLYLAYHDELTGIHNRTHWQDVLRSQITTNATLARRMPLAVLFVDLDHFKEVNDGAGHAHGDEILIATADRLRACAGSRDVVGRLGGDEFAVVCHSDDPDVLARRILGAFRIPFVVEGRPSELSATIGIARYPEDGETVEELLRNADQALYHGKREGGDSFNRYHALMSEDRRRKRTVREALVTALAKKEFLLSYQPIYDFKTLECESVEALIRWHSESLGAISPTIFIPIAEETELMREIGRWTLESAIGRLAVWHRQLASGMPERVAVNVSVRQLRDPRFFEHLTGLLREYGVDARRLELEITESAAMADTDAAIELLARCRALGARVTLDDFGTHFSSLTYLQRLPIDSIKIDRTFVAGLPFEEGDAAIVRNIINLGHDMNRTIVAEGIETREQFDWLRNAKCDFAQGFLLARPMMHDDIERRVAAKFSKRMPLPRLPDEAAIR